MIYSESPRRKQINQQVSWGHWFAFANIILAITISSVYVVASPAPSSILSSVYLFLTWFGHISFITFFGFIVLLLPLCYQVTNQKVLRIVGSITAAIALALLAFDALLFNKTGFHISLSSAQLLRTETQGQISGFTWLQWFYLVLLFVIWLMFQLVIANLIHKRIKEFQAIKIGKYLTTGFCTCFVVSHAIHVWADARLYSPVLEQDNMFPLSYPATAKTLMSRAGLLDLQDYRQRQNLQFDDADISINYPPQAIYCSIDNTKKVLVLKVDEYQEDFVESLTQASLTNHGYHFVSNSIQDDYFASLIYGMPQAFLNGINAKEPVLLALPAAFDLPIFMHSQQAIAPTYLFSEQMSSKDEVLQNLEGLNNGLFIMSVSTKEASELDLKALFQNASVMVISPNAKNNTHSLYSNIATDIKMSATEDIAPSIIKELGCAAQADQFSIGQAIQAPMRKWSLSTQGPHLIVIHDGLITEVSRDGSFEIRDYQSNQKVLTEIDTNLLSRAIKHFSRFTKQQVEK